MRRSHATDCRVLSFNVAEVYDALLDFESYPRWWPQQLRVRVLEATPDHLAPRIEIRPRGSEFTCEVCRAIPDREILIRYVDGVHRGTGRWTLEKVAEGTRACYQIDLEPHGWFPRLLSNFLDFGKMHSTSMENLFDGLEVWLRAKSRGEGP